MKLILKDETELKLIDNGLTEYGRENRLSFTVPTDNYTVESLEELLTKQNLTSVKVLDDENRKLRSDLVGFTEVISIKKINKFSYVENEQRVSIPVLVVELKKPEIVYATQEDIDMLSDAVAELAEIIGGEV